MLLIPAGDAGQGPPWAAGAGGVGWGVQVRVQNQGHVMQNPQCAPQGRAGTVPTCPGTGGTHFGAGERRPTRIGAGKAGRNWCPGDGSATPARALEDSLYILISFFFF